MVPIILPSLKETGSLASEHKPMSKAFFLKSLEQSSPPWILFLWKKDGWAPTNQHALATKQNFIQTDTEIYEGEEMTTEDVAFSHNFDLEHRPRSFNVVSKWKVQWCLSPYLAMNYLMETFVHVPQDGRRNMLMNQIHMLLTWIQKKDRGKRLMTYP